MSEKSYTILLTSNTKGETRSWLVSSTWLKASFLLAGLAAVVLAGAAVDYSGLLLQAGENKRLRAENADLHKKFEIVESKLETLEKGIERVNTFSTKLKLITNIQDEDRPLKLAIGPTGRVDKSMQEVSGWDRDPDAINIAKDSAEDGEFLAHPPLDLNSGELAVDSNRDYASLSIRIDKALKQTQLLEQGVFELHETLSERQSLLMATPNIKPARGWFTSRFGYRLDPFTGRPTMHAGVDIAAPPGTSVFSPADGVVSYVGYESGYGKIVSIDHGYGVVTRYAHNSQVFVEVGQKIKRRDVISAIGNTGRSSGPHLHYEVRVHGLPVDPMNYVLGE